MFLSPFPPRNRGLKNEMASQIYSREDQTASMRAAAAAAVAVAVVAAAAYWVGFQIRTLHRLRRREGVLSGVLRDGEDVLATGTHGSFCGNRVEKMTSKMDETYVMMICAV